MGFLVFHARIGTLIQQQSDLQYRLMRIQRRISDLSRYAELIGNGKITAADLASIPASMVGRTMNYLNYAHNTAVQYMNQNAPYYQQLMQQNGQVDPMMIQFMKKKLYEQSRDQSQQIATRYIKEEEDKLTQEQESVKTSLERVKQDLEACKQGRKDGLEAVKPNYTGLG